MNTVVSRTEWLAAREDLLLKERASFRARDEVNAARRTLPMVRVDKDYEFETSDGRASLLDLFGGHRQLIIYHFMMAPGSDHRCPGCSLLVDSIPDNLEHLYGRDTALTVVSRAPLSQAGPYRDRMGWTVPWVSSYGSDFNDDFEATATGGVERSVVNVFLHDGDGIFHTYNTFGRGVDLLETTLMYLDLTPLGRQESWELPAGRGRNSPASTWWRLHDEYTP